MKTNSILGVVISILVIIVMTTYAQQRSAKHQSWEYKTVYSNAAGFEGEKTFNELGAQGWELAAAAAPGEYVGVSYIFKRTK